MEAQEKSLASHHEHQLTCDPQKLPLSISETPLDELNSNADVCHRNDETIPNALPDVPALSVKQERIFLAANCWCMFLVGWDAGTLGPLLPTIQKHYHLDYTIVSMIFVSVCCGTIPGSVAAGYLTDKIGFGKLVALGAVIQLATYSILAAAPPFPVFCVIYMLNGVASVLQISAANIFITGLPNLKSRPTNLGIMHAIFGSGAFAAPLVATQFAQQRHWSFHYLTCLGIAVVNNIVMNLVFKWKRQEVLVPEMAVRSISGTDDTATSDHDNGGTKLLRVLRLSAVQYMAIFTLIYVGIEFTIGGWVFTYLLNYRGGKPSAGYVTSGFFGGLTLGRVGLLQVNRMVGPERAIILYIFICMALEFTVWFVPNLIENAVAVSIIGFFLGPFYPVMLNVAGRKLPKRLLAGSIGWISAVGNIGTAAFPFATGALASKYGVAVLHPLLVAMFGALLMMWLLAMASKVPESTG
ncbi:hypothetical protein FRB94_012779 [Tulasnella sp. JGI-2019a]|nr:hypothetical protein FRB94_012779 [Tulasnella sp. JGI-2019a]